MVNDDLDEATLKKKLAQASEELLRNFAALKSRYTELTHRLPPFEDFASSFFSLSLVNDEDLAEELRRRGYKVSK